MLQSKIWHYHISLSILALVTFSSRKIHIFFGLDAENEMLAEKSAEFRSTGNPNFQQVISYIFQNWFSDKFFINPHRLMSEPSP